MDGRESTESRYCARGGGLSAGPCARQPYADSWYRAWPDRALDTVDELDLAPLAAVLDVGGGDGRVAGGLLARGHVDVTVLAPGGPRPSRRAEGAVWCSSGLDTWHPSRTFDVWHDRAWLQFRLPGRGWQQYLDALRRSTHRGSLAILSSFTPPAEPGCGRWPMRLRSDDLALLLGAQFALVAHRDDTHLTTCGSEEAFQWSVFERLY
jgi:hypothetical protein